MKYLILLVILTSCQVRYTIETPWSTQPGVYWNKVSNVQYVAYTEKTEYYTKADYPGFATSFVIEKDKVKIYIDRQYYESKCTVYYGEDITIAKISDCEYVIINLATGITNLKYRKMNRVYVKDHI